MNQRVVVTGIGVCSALGNTPQSFWSALCAGSSGIQALDDLGTPAPVPGGRVAQLPPWEEKRRRYPPDRMIQLAHHAVAQLILEELPVETGLWWGTGFTAIASIESCYEAWFLHDKVRADTVPACMPTSVLAHLCSTFNLQGMSSLVSASCASGIQAVGQAWEMLRHGVLQTAVVGGSDAPLTPGMFRAWKPLRVLASQAEADAYACRPFSYDRCGLVLAEGAGALVLETLEHAQQRGAPILAEITQFHATTSPGSLVAPDVVQQARTVEMALKRADLLPTDIDYVNAHATGTRVGDAAETETIKMVFKESAATLPVSSIKGATGHAMGASSMLEIIATVLALKHQLVPPTINWQPGDAVCDLDYVPHVARPAPINIALKQSFGFGGANAVLLLQRFVDDHQGSPL